MNNSSDKYINENLKTGDCVIYNGKSYWKMYEVTKVNRYTYGYKCLGCSYCIAGIIGEFSKTSRVAINGVVISRSEATALLLAKEL